MRQFKPQSGSKKVKRGKNERYASAYFPYDLKIRETLKIFYKLNEWERSFITSVQHVQNLSFKQKACVNRIYDKNFVVKIHVNK